MGYDPLLLASTNFIRYEDSERWDKRIAHIPIIALRANSATMSNSVGAKLQRVRVFARL